MILLRLVIFSRLPLLPATFLACLLLPLFATCAQAAADADGLVEKSLIHDGRQRTFYVHLPTGYDQKKILPVVLLLHGGGKSDGRGVAQRSRTNEIADREGFLAVYPNGINAQWYDGRGATVRRGKDVGKVDDVGYIAKLIDLLIATYKGDPQRVYVTGVSNGGMLTLRLGCEIGYKLAAIAPVIANLPKKIAKNDRPAVPLPVLLMNGTADPIVPWRGGFITLFGQKYGEVISTQATVDFWRKRNDCLVPPIETRLPDTNKEDHSQVKVSRYKNPRNENEVVLYTIEGGGHALPGSKARSYPLILGYKNMDIRASEVIWAFFKKHRRSADATKFAAGYERGEKEAVVELAAGNASLYVFGKRRSGHDFDFQTGLTKKSIAGCIISQKNLGRTAGHNGYIRRYVKKNGAPANSRFRWRKDIEFPARYMAGLAKESLLPLRKKPLMRSDKKFNIALRINENFLTNGRTVTIPQLFLTRIGQKELSVYLQLKDLDSVQIAWGASGSYLLFVRYQSFGSQKNKTVAAVLDLRSGKWLNRKILP